MMPRYGKPRAKRKPSPKKIQQPKQTKTSYTAKGKQVELSHSATAFAAEAGIGYWEKTGDAVSRYDRQTLVNIERQQDDENSIYAAIKDRMCSNLLGPNGFTLQARTGFEDINQYIETELWPSFTASPEYRDLFTWKDVQYAAMRDMIGPGDIGFVKLSNGQIQAIENELINTPSNDQLKKLPGGRKVEQGIEMTDGGKVTGYWVTKPDPTGFAANKGRRVSKQNFIYCHGKIQRFSRSRPIPPFIQVMSSLYRMDDIMNSEAVGWQLLAKHAFIVNQAAADETAFSLSEDDPNYQDGRGQIDDKFTEHDAGTIMWGEVGEKIEAVKRDLPGKDFPASVRAFMQLFAMRYGLPLEILMLDWSKTNFSSGKAALTQATQMIREWQVRLVEQFHQQVYEWKVRQWIAEGLIPDFPEAGNHEWFPPILPWVDPKTEAESWGIQIDRGLVTYSSALKQQGKDRENENEQREADILAAIARSEKIFEDTGVQVSWKTFAGYAEGKTEAAMGAGGSGSGSNTEGEQTTEELQAREVAELIQKIYLGRGVVVTTEEARTILNRAGAGLSEDLPDELKPREDTPNDD